MPVVQLSEVGNLREIDAGTDALGSKREIELIAGGDNSLSMRELVDGEGGSGPSKAQVLIDTMAELATQCWELDSQAKEEAAAGVVDDDGLPAGGLLVIRWATDWTNDGDWNPHTIEQKAAKFRFDGRGTRIMQMVEGMTQAYTEEFCVDEETGQPTPVASRPALLLAGVTDGWCSDNAEFERWAARLGGDTTLVLALIGSGPEYDKAAREYGAIAETNPHFILILVGQDTTAVKKVPEAFLRVAGQYQGEAG